MSDKISIRFFDDREVRAVWDEENAKWWFSVVDIVAAITESPRPRKYWNALKTKLKQDGNQLSSRMGQLKLVSTDGKKYATDCFSQDDVIEVVKLIPGKKSLPFLDWFTYSDNTIDGQSKKKAYALFASSLIDEIEVGTTKGLQQIHAYLFGGLYDFAGQIRKKNIAKGGFQFAMAQFLENTLKQVEKMPEENFEHIADKYIEMNIAHPFMEGNGRTTRIWLDMILKKRLQKCVDWSQIGKNDYMNAMIESPQKSETIKNLIQNALTDDIHSREMFMKGIDYSYYYEENE
jgi:cell filamentation protein